MESFQVLGNQTLLCLGNRKMLGRKTNVLTNGHLPRLVLCRILRLLNPEALTWRHTLHRFPPFPTRVSFPVFLVMRFPIAVPKIAQIQYS
jgi:hypothetical protein